MTALSPPYSPLFARYQSQRPRRAVVAGIAAVAVISLLLIWSSSSSGSGHRATVLRKVFGSTCSPYDQPGFLNLDIHNIHKNRWTPFASTDAGPKDECRSAAPALTASFLRASWAESKPTAEPKMGTDWANEPLGPDGKPWEDVEWARNRTMLFFGDSITRYTTTYFCEMAGEPFIELNSEHPWAPPPIDKDFRTNPKEHEPYSPPDPPLDPTGWNRAEKGNPYSHTGHYCYVPGLDFLLIHVHMYGLDQEDYWTFKGTYIPPYTFEERLNMLAVEYMKRIRATTARDTSSPELIYINSGMWDYVRYSHADIQKGLEVDTPLSLERLTSYRDRVRNVTLEVAHAFPRSTIYWASTHYPIVSTQGWFFREGAKPKTRPDIKLIRLQEMHEAAMSAFADSPSTEMSRADRKTLANVQLNRWGLAMRGFENFQIDDLHPRFLPGGYLWADMALYDMRKVVRG